MNVFTLFGWDSKDRLAPLLFKVRILFGFLLLSITLNFLRLLNLRSEYLILSFVEFDMFPISSSLLGDLKSAWRLLWNFTWTLLALSFVGHVRIGVRLTFFLTIRWASIVNKRRPRKQPPSSDFLFESLHSLQGRLSLSVDTQYFSDFLVVEYIGNGLGFELTELSKKIHAAIGLGDVFQVPRRAKYFTLEQNNRND